MKLRVTKHLDIPDPIRVARSRRAPELGPRVLFFSGGSALKALSRKLKRYTHNSIHLMTPFDSGGSSATLREAFGMLSVGDLRNRLIALADETALGNPEIYALFSHRFSSDMSQEAGRARLEAMVSGSDPLITAVPAAMRQLAQTYLRFFVERMPPDFDLRLASIGNLILAGGYLCHNRNIDSVIFLFTRLVQGRGHVRPVVDVDLHLMGTLASGERVIGQHFLTGKEVPPLTEAITDIGLVNSLSDPQPAQVAVGDETARLIRDAELICYPMGSFYTSVLANLLPIGVGRAIAEASCPKLWIPNTGQDPEQHGMSLQDALDTLLNFARRDTGVQLPVERIVQYVLVDSSRADAYAYALTLEALAERGLQVIDRTLVSEASFPHIDPDLLVPILLSLAS